jgi:hypothetical protein
VRASYIEAAQGNFVKVSTEAKNVLLPPGADGTGSEEGVLEGDPGGV